MIQNFTSASLLKQFRPGGVMKKLKEDLDLLSNQLVAAGFVAQPRLHQVCQIYTADLSHGM